MKPRLAATVSSVKMDWRTPEWLLDIARMSTRTGQIDLDPCTTADNPTNAKRFYTPEDNGLEQDWFADGGLIWCNPPYGRELKHWARKWCETRSWSKMILVPARTDQPWFAEIVDAAEEVFFLRKRVRFVGADTGAPFASVVAACEISPVTRERLVEASNWAI